MTLLLVLLPLSGCSSLFFFPDKQHYFNPAQANISYEEIYLSTEDGETLHGWHLQTKAVKQGIIYFLHGNAENISTHIASVAWLTEHGYDVFALDYRGYGKSTGSPDIKGALTDIGRGFKWLTGQSGHLPQNRFILGQSLGGALALSFASRQQGLEQYINGLIIDAGFPSYRGIAKEKLNDWWLTWSLQYPLSWLIPANYDSRGYLKNISPVPLLVIHSTEDQIVPFHQGEAVYAEAAEPKDFLVTDTAHTATFNSPEYRAYLLRFLQRNRSKNSSARE